MDAQCRGHQSTKSSRMSSLDSIFTSSLSEKRWSDQVSKNFDSELAIDIKDVLVSVFSVPKSISAFNPEAYVPQAVAFGPYHHFNPELYQMERYKVVAIQAFLKSHEILDIQTRLIGRLKQLSPIIRACYHKYLDLDDDTLAWVLFIDGLFLIDLLCPSSDDFDGKILTRNSLLCRDMLILENQFPVIILKEIRETLQKVVVVKENNYDLDDELYKLLKDFCVVHSPLPLGVESNFPPGMKFIPLHLLDLMYFLILNTRIKESSVESPSKKANGKTNASPKKAEEQMNNDLILNVTEILDVTINGVGGDKLRPYKVIRNLPWEKMYNLLGINTSNEVEQTSSALLVEEILIPSVTYLSTKGGVKFKTTGGIRDIEFSEKDSTLYLPELTINNVTEVLLRNLVAYEAANSNSRFELAQYVDLMCGIIDTAEDAKILVDNGIIKSEGTSQQIADLFNGMNKSGAKVCNSTVEKINEYFSKKPKVRVYRFWKKKVYNSWKVLTVVSTILLLLLLILQSFCEIYGCPRLFFNR